MSIELIGVTKRFGEFAALRGVDLQVRNGELLALLGPSGSGKTTLLRIIAGLDWPESGDVRFDGQSAVNRGVRERRVGFVFQHYALFRHMKVFDNVAFGLRVRPRDKRPAAEEITRRVNELLKLVQIDWLADRYPAELSGGQRQRVALARALAIEPSVLLLDEPFGALDAKVRTELRRWLRRLHEEMGMTSVFVTHDQEEALELADRVVVMNQGRIEQVGTPDEVYENPANPFVYQFVGRVNRLICEARGGTVHHPDIAFEGVAPADKQNGPVKVYVRPHDLVVDPAGDAGAVIRFVSVTGPVVRIEVETTGATSLVEVELGRPQFQALNLSVGMKVRVRALKAHVFAEREQVA